MIYALVARESRDVTLAVFATVCVRFAGVRVRSHGHRSAFPFTGCLSLVQASPARVERSRSPVQAHNSTRVY